MHHCSCRIAALVAASLLSASACARDAFDLDEFMRRAPTSTEATVVLVPAMRVYRDALGEAELYRQGCHYATSKPASIRSLVAVLDRSAMVAGPVFRTIDMREAASFALADGARLRILIEDNHGGRAPVGGIAEAVVGDDVQRVSVTANSSLASDLRQWAADNGGPGEGTDAACGRQLLPQPGPLPPIPK